MRTVLLCCVAVAPCVALEVVRRDLALALEALPVAFDYTLTTPGGTLAGDDEFDQALGVRLGGRWSLGAPGAVGAWVLGADARLGEADYDNGTYRTLGLGLSAGYGWRFARRWQAYAEPALEIGWATLDLDASDAAPAIAADGTHLMWGLRSGVLYGLTDHWQVQAEIGWVDIASDLDASGGRSFTLDQQGVTFALGVVYRISSAPAKLE